MAKSKSEKRGIYLYIDGKEIVNDVNHIEKECRQLTHQLKTMTLGSEEYNRTMAKIQHLQGILKQHRQEIKGITAETKKATVSVGSMVDWFNRFGGVILSVIGFLTGFTLALRAIRDERNKLEESQAGLKALTGLDDENIAWLTEQAKTLSTTMTKEGLRVRQSAAEILDAFMLVGSAKPELLGDKEALKAVTEEAMRLQAAAKDITLNEAVDSLTLSLNQYGAAADQAGRFTNVLAAGSQAGSANIASQAKAIRNAGTAAASANVPIEQTVALIETLAYRGIKDEVAGTGLKKFFLVLQTGADETNPKIVGLDKALENLKNKNMDAGAIKKMFGEEGYNTASVILQNTEMVKDFTAAVTGTNVAYEQAAINSDTAQAKLEQARNKMKLAAIDLGEKLNPALTVSTNMLTNVIKYLPGLIDWCNKWGDTILYVASCIAIYTLRTKASTIATTVWNTVTKTATALQLAYGIAINTVSGYTVTSFTQLRRLSTLMTGHNILLKTVRVSTYLFAGAMQVLQGRVDLAAKSIRAAWAVMRLSPVGWLSTALFAGGAAFVYLYRRTHEYMNVQKATNLLQEEAVKSTADQRKELDALWLVAQNNNNAMKVRKEAMEKINKIAPDYLGDITLETINTQKAADAKARYVEQLQKEAMLKGASTHIEEESKKLVEYQAALDKALSGQKKAREGATYAQTGFTAYDAAVEQLKFDIAHTKEALKGYMTIYEQINNELYSPVKEVRTIETVTKELNNAKTVLDKLKSTNTEYFSSGELIAYNAQLKKASSAVVQLSGELERLKEIEKNGKGTNGSSGGSESEEERKKRVNKDLEDIETRHMRQMTHLQKLYLEGEIKTGEEYTALQIDLEKKFLGEKLAVVGLEAHEREKLQVKMLESQIKFNESCKKQDEKAEKDRQKVADKTAKERFSVRQKQLRIELEEATTNHYKNLTSEEDFAQEVNNIRQRYWDDLLHNYQLTEEQRTEIQKEQAEVQTDAEKEKYDKTMEMHKQYASLVTDIASDFGETIGEMIANGELSLKNFLRETILMALDALERVIEISILEITAKNLAATAPLSFIGAAKAAAQVAAIKAAFAVVKGLVGNFYTGGYTGSGSWDQPQGIVHSNEFVANRFAVANPNLRPIFDAIDVAQRSGNVGNLTAEDIAAVAGPGKSTRTVPVKTPAASATTTTNDPAVVAMLIECTRTLRKLKTRLDEPLMAETYLTGKRGINQAQKEYQKLNNNKSRNKL
ncbi:phage tail tape measure protein [Bacteroides stercoris]|uniref:phage tail tape measure protein n=1 Tax=Bacteroides stercoris TaxID=46506 RepID=UPI001269C5E7|nr:phage tail tape measure protein [Bacteroides stercoris]KAB5267943.1 phage tail tape measure protein [Bacteroides stercoris]